MKNILYIVSTLKNCGPTNQLYYIIKHLDSSQFTPNIITLSPESGDSAKAHFESVLGLKIESLSLSRMQGAFSSLSKVKQYILDQNIDMVHTQGIRADGLAKNINIPKISTLRNFPYSDYPTKFGKLKGYFMALSHMKIVKSNKDNCIACSKSIADEFYANGLKLRYIQNGVDLDKYFPLSQEDKLVLRGRLNIGINKKVLITVGSLIPRKNVKTIIDAFNLNSEKDSILFIIGDGLENKELQSIAANNIRFLGNVRNVVEYLQISDCFISASLAEGLPNSVLEAMSCNLPLLLSDIPPHKELCSENAFFFKVHDVDGLSKAISSFNVYDPGLSNLVTKNFSAHLMSTRYQKLYLERLC